MKEVKINITGKQYIVKLAQTDSEKETGLQNVTELPENKGMLFVFNDEDPDYDGEPGFWMKDTYIPLDIIFIDENLLVTSVQQGIPESEDMITDKNVAYVLEVNSNSGIKVGDELEFSPEKNADKNKMLVLGSDGKPQMELEGGERIVSRKETKVLIKKAKKANALDTDSHYITLGKYLFKVLEGQDNRPEEYVKSKE